MCEKNHSLSPCLSLLRKHRYYYALSVPEMDAEYMPTLWAIYNNVFMYTMYIMDI